MRWKWNVENFKETLYIYILFFVPGINSFIKIVKHYMGIWSKINHLFYMDDMKLYARNDDEMEGLLKTEQFPWWYLHEISAT